MKTFGDLLKQVNTPKEEEKEQVSEDTLKNPMSIGHFINVTSLPEEDLDSIIENIKKAIEIFNGGKTQ